MRITTLWKSLNGFYRCFLIITIIFIKVLYLNRILESAQLWYLYILRKYLKESNAAAYSVDSDIFYAVIHLQPRAQWRIDGEVWQGDVVHDKKQKAIWTMFGHLSNTHQPPLYHIAKTERYGIVGAEFELIILYWFSCLDPECCNWQTVSRTRASQCTKMLML